VVLGAARFLRGLLSSEREYHGTAACASLGREFAAAPFWPNLRRLSVLHSLNLLRPRRC
jgi:hypothetical protein